MSEFVIRKSQNTSEERPVQVTDPAWFIFEKINDGAFAVLLFAGVVSLALSRVSKKFLQSDFARSISSTVQQINENQLHVEELVTVAKNQQDLTASMGQAVVSLEAIIKSGAVLNTERHDELVEALTNLNNSIRKVL